MKGYEVRHKTMEKIIPGCMYSILGENSSHVQICISYVKNEVYEAMRLQLRYKLDHTGVHICVLIHGDEIWSAL